MFMAYSPAFQFYPGDFTGDRNTIPMSAAEIGAYILLICECWDKDNSLPEDLQDLADIARMDLVQFTVCWDRRIKKCFRYDDKKKCFFHKRLLEEIKKQKAWSKKKSEAGKKGMAKRWEQKASDDNTVISVLGSDITQHNSPSPSLSSSYKEESTTTTTTTAKPKISDDEWLESLCINPAYKNIPVLMEFERAKVWADTNGRQCTRRFFIGWLNRAKPMDVKQNGNGAIQQGTGKVHPNTAALEAWSNVVIIDEQ